MSIKNKLCFLLALNCTYSILARTYRNRKKHFVIMLNPAGDTHHTGRKIGNSFERGVTLQCAEQVKHQLEQEHPHITVLLTRFPGDIVYELQNASLANRLHVNLFVSIHFYQTTETKPRLYLYQFSYHDDFISKTLDLSFYPYDQAHLLHYNTTTSWINIAHNTLNQNIYEKLFTTHGTFTLPFKPLIGITAPSIGIEAGLKTRDDWNTYTKPLVATLSAIIEHNG